MTRKQRKEIRKRIDDNDNLYDNDSILEWLAAKVINENEHASLKEQYINKIDPDQEKYSINHLFEGVEYADVDPEIFALYDATDDFIPENTYYNLECLIKIKKNTNGYTAYSPETTVYENDTTKPEHTYFWEESNGREVSKDEFELAVFRTYNSKNISEDEAIKKIEKVAEDISAQICYEMNCNGATFGDIESSMYERPENKMEEF